MNTPARRALYDNLGKNEALALQVDEAVHAASQDDWRSNPFKVKKLRGAIKIALQMHKPQGGTTAVPMKESYKGKSSEPEDELVEEVLNLVKNQDEY
jgi:type I restriction enzyme R subunit